MVSNYVIVGTLLFVSGFCLGRAWANQSEASIPPKPVQSDDTVHIEPVQMVAVEVGYCRKGHKPTPNLDYYIEMGQRSKERGLN